jgi:ubiquinone/menaquinone biosynthesis C-methylase UbiE
MDVPGSPALVLDHLTALSDPIRVRMLAVLEPHELTVSELCDILQLPQSTVSRHLRTLADGGWVNARREGVNRLYSLPLEQIDRSAQQLWTVVKEQVTSTRAAADDDRRLRRTLAARRSKSEQFFSSSASQWDRLRDELFGSSTHLRALVGLMDPAWTVGDLGCGTGQVAAWIAPFVGRVVAVDASIEMLEAATARLSGFRNIELHRASLEELPIGDGELDAAIALLVLHHNPDPGRVLVEAARVLKPRGPLLVLDMLSHDREEYRQTMGHVWLGFSESQVRRWMTAAGFANIHITTLAGDPKARGPSLFTARGIKESTESKVNRESKESKESRRS